MGAPTDSGVDTPIGIESSAVSAWLDENVPGAQGPYRFEVIAGGHSNLTFSVIGRDGRRMVLRRPPLSHGLASAHDMGREHRVISGLATSSLPVPTTLGMCDDESVNGAPFYVMAHVDGTVIRDEETARSALDSDGRSNASRSLIDNLAALHAIDPHDVGLEGLGRHDGYLARQLKRWYGQWNAQKTRDLPLVDEVHDALLADLPEQTSVSIVHGDYRLDNTMLAADGTVAAILDWEICTLGDPLADIGLLAVYWTGPNDEPSAWAAPATRVEGFWDRDDLITRYGEVSGRDLSRLDVYVAFASWKLACILEGVYARYLGGALGSRDPAELEPFRQQVDAAAQRAADIMGAR